MTESQILNKISLKDTNVTDFGNFVEKERSQINALLQSLLIFFFVLFSWFSLQRWRGNGSLPKTVLKTFSKIPGLPIIGPVHYMVLHLNDAEVVAKAWREKLGRCWRFRVFGKDVLGIHEPSMLKTLYSSNDLGHLEKEPIVYTTLGPIVAKGLLAMPAKDWVRHRKTLNPLFTFGALKRYIPISKKYADKLVENLMSDKFSTSSGTSLGTLIHRTLLGILTDLQTGVSFENTLGQSGAEKFNEDVVAIVKIIGQRANEKPWLTLPFLWNLHPLKKTFDQHLKSLETALRKVRENHVPQSNSELAIDLMINSKWSDEEILAELVTMLAAGKDTLSATLYILLWLLAIEEKHQTVCQQEADKLFDDMEKSGEGMSLSSLSELKYLERCIKETMRLYPAAPFGFSRELKTSLKLSEDMVIKPGTVMTYAPFILHRDSEIYPDPEKFDPDRFLPENVKNRHPYAFMPFSAGPRNCIGWKLSPLLLTVLGATILHNFHLKTTDSRNEIKVKFQFPLRLSKDPHITFIRRRQNDKANYAKQREVTFGKLWKR